MPNTKKYDFETLEKLMRELPADLTVKQAAEIMNVTPLFLRYALMQNRFPFGVGIEMGRNEFYINTVRFIRWMQGEDLAPKYWNLRGGFNNVRLRRLQSIALSSRPNKRNNRKTKTKNHD